MENVGEEKLANNILYICIMPKRKMKGKGTLEQNSAKTFKNIQTANENLKLQNSLLRGKRPLQQPGQLGLPLMYGGKMKGRGNITRTNAKIIPVAYVDKYGGFIHAY